MQVLLGFGCMTVGVLGTALFLGAAPAQTVGEVCSDPAAPCHQSYKRFAPYELSFRLPKSVKPNVPYKSVTFYGVVLKVRSSGAVDECDQGEYSSKLERERRQVQVMFPKRKVFADQQCPDMAAVSYVIAGKSNTSSFLAVYGGRTLKEAQQVLAKVKNKYRSAAIKPMQVVFERIVQ
jgi:hypothetical protein